MMSLTRTATPKDCARCRRVFTKDEIMLGLVRYVEGLYICIQCRETIVKEWALKFKDITELS